MTNDTSTQPLWIPMPAFWDWEYEILSLPPAGALGLLRVISQCIREGSGVISQTQVRYALYGLPRPAELLRRMIESGSLIDATTPDDRESVYLLARSDKWLVNIDGNDANRRAEQ